MRWKVKAAIQNTMARLPRGVSYAGYYRMQRLVGGLRTTIPDEHILAGVQTWRRIVEQGRNPRGALFFEVGTGRAPIVPLACWLMGARGTITLDVNPYLKGELVQEALEYVNAHRDHVARLFGDLLQADRFERLLDFHRTERFSLPRFLDLCGIDYIEPGDAANSGLPRDSVDFHASYTVFEHIAPDVLAGILIEGTRIVREDGLFVHMIDYSDHFSHADESISAINFLQYSDAEWARYAGNRYMYMNRLRHDDMVRLFESCGHRILSVTTHTDERARAQLETGLLRVDERFRGKPHEILSIRGSWLVSERARGPVR
jgi:SAM-dependent methyltransferase